MDLQEMKKLAVAITWQSSGVCANRSPSAVGAAQAPCSRGHLIRLLHKLHFHQNHFYIMSNVVS